jgi:hypothetical protein
MSAQLGRAWAHAAAGEKLQGFKRPDFIKMAGTSSASISIREEPDSGA